MPNLGVILPLPIILVILSVGLIMRFYGRKGKKRQQKKEKNIPFELAFLHLHQTRLKDNRPIGKILGDAVTSSIQTLLMIGGFIILFSVVNKLLFHLHITAFFAKAIEVAFNDLFNYLLNFSIPFISGLFEITFGSTINQSINRCYIYCNKPSLLVLFLAF